MSEDNKMYDVIVIGAGVGGICQIKQLVKHGFNAVVLEANKDLGGTWYKNRYPGCRFDSESYTYGYSFSRELVDEWHWTERFSPQPENLKYLNYVADKFDLRQYIEFEVAVDSMCWDESSRLWRLTAADGKTWTGSFVITCMGVLSVPYLPAFNGMDRFAGDSFHTYEWPSEPLDLSKSRVGIVGTGATGIQVIGELADKVGSLTVFQRHPNWSVPLNNSSITEEEMADIRARFDEIMDQCWQSQSGFEHRPDRRGYDAVSEDERVALWNELYDRPGFALLLANFPETFMEADANRDLSRYVADRIRRRVKDPVTAEKLIPRDHGFGMKRLPLETRYFEAYNRENVRLVDLNETPIETVTEAGIETAACHYDLDVIVYATGFHTVTGALNRMDIRGMAGRSLSDKWRSDTSTYLGVFAHEFPNMMMVAGPQSVSGSTNYPRTIEFCVDWLTKLLMQARQSGWTRIEASREAELAWVDAVTDAQSRMPFSQVKSWFTGYAPGGEGAARHNAYWGGGPRYRKYLEEVEQDGYKTINLG